MWEYCEASEESIFGTKLGDPVADRILDAVRDAGAVGMSDNDIYELFGRNRSANERDRALALLKELGILKCEQIATGGRGRPRTVWVAT